MARTFAHGEQIVRPTSTFQGQQNDTALQQRTSRDQRQDRSTPSWENRGPAWEAWEGDTPPPIPEHLKSDDWLDQHYGALQQPDQKSSSTDLAKLDSEKATLLAQAKQNKPKQSNVPVAKRPYGDKLVDAAKMVPELLKGDAKAAFQKIISDPAFVGQLVGVAAVFTAVQFTPAGPFVNGALLATLGLSAGFDLYNFLTKVGSAKDENGLKDAAGYLKSLVETIGIAAIAGSLKTASRALGAIRADTSTATVWKAIKATQPVYKGTLIPRSFELQVGNKKIWIHGNATEHLEELVRGYKRQKGTDKADLFTQLLLEDFRQAATQASKGEIVFGKAIKVGRWEFVFGKPPAPDKLPSIYHAKPSGNIDVP
jgi:hypothetical protein